MATDVVIKEQVVATIRAALQKMATDAETDPLLLIKQLMKVVHPPRYRMARDAQLYWSYMLEILREDEALRKGVSNTILKLFVSRRQVSLYTDSGLLPDTGFFTELNRILVSKILPEVRDTSEFRDCVAYLFSRRSDILWVSFIPEEERRELWTILDLHGSDDAAALHIMVDEMLSASMILSHRIAAMGLSPHLVRVYPRLRDIESPFLAMNTELVRFVDAFRNAMNGKGEMDDGSHLFVLLEQCQKMAEQIHGISSKLGTSMELSFLLTRLKQHLDRLDLVLRVMTVRVYQGESDTLTSRVTDFLMSAFDGERQHNSLRRHVSNLVSMLALRVTDNAAHTGEHYIANTRSEWFSMLWRAAGAGVLIAVLAFLKIQGSHLHLSPLSQAWLNASIYAGGFAVIYMLNFIIATKQPAMTAATLAGSVSQSTGRMRDKEKMVDLMVDTFRSQLAAIGGNIMVAFPLAMLFLFVLQGGAGSTFVDIEKALHMLNDVRALASPSLLYAAVAGVWLFMAGLVSGYLDNRAAYMQLAPRIAQLNGLCAMLGENGAKRVGDYLAEHAGGLGGNIFFGLMLGLTPVLGNWLGLSLDIRHIAFSSANVGYAIVALDFAVSTPLLVAAINGVLLIGLVNLSVSFALALWVAMRSRKLSFWLLVPVMPLLFRRLIYYPGSFFLPPPRTAEKNSKTG